MIKLILKYKKDILVVAVLIVVFFLGKCNSDSPDTKDWEKQKTHLLDSTRSERQKLASQLTRTIRERDKAIKGETTALTRADSIDRLRTLDKVRYYKKLRGLADLQNASATEIELKMIREYEKAHTDTTDSN